MEARHIRSRVCTINEIERKIMRIHSETCTKWTAEANSVVYSGFIISTPLTKGKLL